MPAQTPYSGSHSHHAATAHYAYPSHGVHATRALRLTAPIWEAQPAADLCYDDLTPRPAAGAHARPMAAPTAWTMINAEAERRAMRKFLADSA